MLTDLKLKNLKSTTKKTRYTDRDGLTLEHWPSGTKSFIFRFQWQGKPQTLTLGRYPAMSLAQAREFIDKYNILLDQGIDPRAALKAEEETRPTLKFITESWFEKYKPNWRESTLRSHKRSVYRDIIPFLGDKLLDDITKADLLAIIRPHEEQGHYEIAHRLHDRLKAIFDYALAASLTSNYPFLGLKKALTPKPKIKNQLCINPNEAHQMLAALKQGKANTVIKLYVELLAHVFVRPRELRLAKWSEFNLQDAEWHVPTERMKMDAPHWVPISSQAMKIIKELRLLTGFTPYLFTSPGAKSTQPISETCARKLLHKTGYKGRHTLHGFRALASTVLHEQSDFRMDAIEAQMGHKIQGVRGVYLRADFKQERRALMEWYSSWLVANQGVREAKKCQ
ncbi:MAG: hypothetical protein RLZ35_1290 [Pseudomonadota bacterium]|jgi:integrase